MPTVYNKVVAGSQTLIDLSQDTVTSANDIVSGKVGHLADGTQVTGTGGGGTGAISVVDTADSGGGVVRTITAVDISDTTAVAADVASGKYFYTADGTKTAGTASGSSLTREYGSVTITTATQYLTVTGLGGTPKFIKFIIHDAATNVGDSTLKSVSGIYVMGACMIRATNNAGSGYGYSAYGTEAAWEASTQTVYENGTQPSAAGQIYATTSGFCARAYSSSYSWKAGYTFDWQVWY